MHSLDMTAILSDLTVYHGLYCLQVNLTWLDLSFNNISKLEGLSTLTKLTDLSLFSNKLEKIENIESLEALVVLSVGKQTISSLPTAGCQQLTSISPAETANCDKSAHLC